MTEGTTAGLVGRFASAAKPVVMRRAYSTHQALLAVCMLLLAVPSFARLGETYKECDKRYGKPLQVTPMQNGTQQRIYRKAGFVVTTVFHYSGRVVEIYFRKADGSPLSLKESVLFLRASGGKSSWRKVDQLAEWRRTNAGLETDEALQADLMRDLASFILWTRQDGKAEASYDRDDAVLLISDSAWLQKERDRATAESHDEVLGF